MGKPKTLPSLEMFREEERCIKKTETLPSYKTFECTTRRQHTKHECSNDFVKRRGAWASPKCFLTMRCFVKRRGASERLKHSLVTRHWNAQEENKHTKHEWMEEGKSALLQNRIFYYKNER